MLNSASPLEANIRNLRTGDLIVKVIDANGQPVVDAVVKLEQTKHYFQFGTALSSEMFSNTANPADRAQYLKLAKQLFNASVHENALKWYSTESVRGQVSYADADRILNWSESNGLKMRGHALFWAPEQWNQDWLKALSPEKLRLAVHNRATDTCTRYRGRISEYDVLNEMLHGDFFQKRLGEGIVKDMFEWCKQADPSARLYVNDYNILNGEKLDNYVNQIRSLLKQGVPVGGIGVQSHIRQKITAAQVKQSLDTLAQFGLPIKITEFSVVADTEEEKAKTLRDIYRVAFAHPAVEGILMWGFWDGAIWEPTSALFRKDWQPLPAAQAYLELVYDQWWTKIDTLTDKAGEAATRAFFGDYHVTVNVGNSKSEQTFSFSPGEKTPQVIQIMAR
jgi:GH35 family endo-1,4-beta-xylanase